MLKRTKGRLLITLLVVTGLAGTLNTGTISQKERKQAVTILKNSKSEITAALEGLTEKQVNFKISPHDLSIAEIINNVAAIEINFASELAAAMKQPADSEKRLILSFEDAEVLGNKNPALNSALTPKMKANKSKADDALNRFTAIRTDHIKYVRTSTEDLRNHVVQTEAGWVDYYQKFLLLGIQTTLAAKHIKRIKTHKSFPK